MASGSQMSTELTIRFNFQNNGISLSRRRKNVGGAVYWLSNTDVCRSTGRKFCILFNTTVNIFILLLSVNKKIYDSLLNDNWLF